jgi:hypothetical protein
VSKPGVAVSPVLVLAGALLVGGAGIEIAAQPRPAGGERETSPIQHGAQPNPGEVRPGSPEGDTESATEGMLLPERERRIFGLPLPALLVIGSVIVVLLALPAVIRRSRRRPPRVLPRD